METAPSNGDDSSSLPVLIIGAGSCGLAIAQGLRKHGISAIVFEKDTCLDPDGCRKWSFALAWAGPVLESLVGADVWARIQTASVDPSENGRESPGVPLWHAVTGERLSEVKMSDVMRLYRPRFRGILAQGADIRFGKKLQNIVVDGSVVKANFEDGTMAEGRLLIGTDGARSRTRTLLLKSENADLARLPYVTTFIHAKFTREQALFLRSFHPQTNAFVHPDGMTGGLLLLDAADKDRPESWSFMMYTTKVMSVEEQNMVLARFTKKDHLRRAKDVTQTWAEPIRSAHKWLQDDLESIYFMAQGNWDPRLPEHHWDNHGGLVTLAGDSAHTMTHQRGQGLNHAIDDAGHLVRLLSAGKGRTQAELINEYEAEMRQRAGKEVEISEMNTRMVHDWAQVLQSPLMKKGMGKEVKN